MEFLENLLKISWWSVIMTFSRYKWRYVLGYFLNLFRMKVVFYPLNLSLVPAGVGDGSRIKPIARLRIK